MFDSMPCLILVFFAPKHLSLFFWFIFLSEPRTKMASFIIIIFLCVAESYFIFLKKAASLLCLRESAMAFLGQSRLSTCKY